MNSSPDFFTLFVFCAAIPFVSFFYDEQHSKGRERDRVRERRRYTRKIILWLQDVVENRNSKRLT